MPLIPYVHQDEEQVQLKIAEIKGKGVTNARKIEAEILKAQIAAGKQRIIELKKTQTYTVELFING
jgi:hypothetical protein